MFVGYSNNHTGDTCSMWNPITNNIHLSRDVTWLRQMFCLPKTLSLLPTTTTAPTVTYELGVEVEDMFPEIIPAG